MTTATIDTLPGFDGERATYAWSGNTPRYLAVLVHGYGEHLGRYDHVAEHLVAHGAAVVGLDHVGHGRSAGEPVLIHDLDAVVDDLAALIAAARPERPGLPVIMIGHSMGGLIAARYAQGADHGLRGLVLSGPVLGRWEAAEQLLAAPEIPEVPIDPATLSRDPSVGEAYATDPLVWHGTFRRETLEALLTALERIAADGEVGLPVLWVHGEDDQLVPIGPSRAGVEALVPAGQLTAVTYPEARHEVLNETNRGEVLAEITGFVDRVLGGVPSGR